ncbi:BglG family transcription antiterminator [Enterococcus larvae]|uniref:BglG family transcription antiterminator n=1 Tax=Enterococcus larvae TaxID=2794352 RepID=UPI003F2A04C8
MISDERGRKVINYLLERPIHNIEELELQTKLTRRQLEYSLDKINEWLSDNGEPLLKVENNRVVVSEKTREQFFVQLEKKVPIKNYWMNSEERIKYLFLLLFYFYDDYFSVNHFVDAFGVGKTTVINDLKKLNMELEQQTVSVVYSRKEGYQLVGEEGNIRYYLMKMILWDFTEHQSTFIYDLFIEKNELAGFQETKRIVEKMLQKYHITFVENRLTEFIYTFIFLKKRIASEVHITGKQYKAAAMIPMKEYQFSEELLKADGISSQGAILYVCSWILGLSIGTPDKMTKDYETIMDLVERISMRFEALSGIRFSNEEKAVRQLYAHFRPAYYRLLFKLPIINPLYSKIKEEYSELYDIVEEALKPIASLFEEPVPEDEIAFLTMHFASLCSSAEDRQYPKKVALVVCPNGIGSSSILYTELKALFPELSFIGPVETNEVEKLGDSYDLIFSTVPNVRLFYTKKLVYVVSPIMSTAEKYRLISDVYTHIGNFNFKIPRVDKLLTIIDKYTMIENKSGLEKELADYLIKGEEQHTEMPEEGPELYRITAPDMIQTGVKAGNWEEAIRLSAAPLLKNKRISREYIETMIQTAKDEGPYMVIAKHVALPHARPEDGALDLGISITVLDFPIVFGSKENDPVKYIFCLSAPKNNRHLNAMAELVNLLDDQGFYALLDSSRDPKQIYEYIYEQSRV